MTDSRIQELVTRANAQFTLKQGLDQLNQELAEQFYPERADFTGNRTLGEDFASHLMSSYPVMCRRDLGNMLSSMLRPPETEWFKVRPQNEKLRDEEDIDEWCEYATGVMRRAMYDPKSRFVRATKEGDHDFVAFGMCAITVEMNTARDGLLYRCWHLRDLAWVENEEGEIDTIFRRWKPTARNLMQRFGEKKCHPEVKRLITEGKPDTTVDCMHVVMPSEDHQWQKKPRNAAKFPHVCLYIDCANQHVMEEVPLQTNPWVIARWQTVSGYQYGFSSASLVAIADARLLQVQTTVILEQGEKANDPPIIAKRDIFQSSPNTFAGGITYADMEGDEKLSEIMEVMQPDRGGHVTGMELIGDTKKTINDLFFLNRLFLPPPDESEQMTAYEVQRRTQEFIRQALPLFEPVESEYNVPLCEKTFEILLNNRAFRMPPEGLLDAGMDFSFESPLKQAKERADVQRFQEVAQISTLAREALDPSLPDNVDSEAAFRDAVRGIGAPAAWQREKKDVAQMRMQRAQAQQMQQIAEAVSQGATVAGQVGDAAQSLRAGGVLPPMQEAA